LDPATADIPALPDTPERPALDMPAAPAPPLLAALVPANGPLPLAPELPLMGRPGASLPLVVCAKDSSNKRRSSTSGRRNPGSFTLGGNMTVTQNDKGARFRELHQRPGAFVIANAWDAGSARVLAGLGFEAVATSSGAFANTLGRLDGAVTRDEALAHTRSLCDAIDAPVSADLENGFGDDPASAAETIRLAAGTGLVGGSIEDSTSDRQRAPYDLGQATERVAAAASAARALPFPFLLTARTENYLRGKPDLDDTIKRLQAFERAGADVLFAPGLPDLAAVQAVCQALSKPVNYMIGIPRRSFSVAELQAAGVKRISLATSLFRAAMAGVVEAANEVRSSGTFTFVDRLPSSSQYQPFLKR
jgi:2-methylisocitrate lyase-like PEP mutase family enzyme